MQFSLGAGSKKELVGVHPRLVDVVHRAIALTIQDFTVHDGVRTVAEQRRYVQSGVSKTMESMHLPQADGFSHAVDLVPYINGKLRWEWPAIYPIAVAMRLALSEHNRAEKLRSKDAIAIRWGGNWGSLAAIDPKVEAMNKAVQDYSAARRAAGKSAFIDGPHFELVL